MKPLKSFRSRLIVGSLLWAAGLLGITAGVMSILPRHSALLAFHGAAVIATALALVLIGVSLLRRGLSPFEQLRVRLAAVRAGREPRVAGTYPSEVQPLVDDLNALLAEREQRIARALARAGDLAHGLKTPLAVIAREGDRAGTAGQHDLAEAIEQQVARMRRQLDFHLAQARAAVSWATGAARAGVREAAEGIVRALERLHADRPLGIDVDASSEHVARVAREDLEELLGNLLDNACKWARSRIVLSSAAQDGRVIIMVDDDGPGLAERMRDVVLQRGVRADEALAGSGLGLAIVRELADLYGGSIALDRAPIGGLRARLDLPAA